MTPEHWQDLKHVLSAALEMEPDQRLAYLDRACAGDHSLRQEVESLLASGDSIRSSFLQSPPVLGSEQACAYDEAVRRRVESLLAHYEQASSRFLEEPALEMATKVLTEDRALPGEPLRHPAYSEGASAGERQLRPEVDQARRSAFAGLGRGAEFQGSDRFLVQHRLGAGGFGVVYQVYDREQEAVVALKTLPHAEGGPLYHFKREFRALADISHPNLVTLYELTSEGDQYFFTMELIQGTNFVDYVRKGTYRKRSDNSELTLPGGPARPQGSEYGTGDAASLVAAFDPYRLRASLRQLAEGVSALHAADKLHRDLKPSNVLVAADGRVVILDFGLIAEVASPALGESWQIVGTPAYMSPEQAAGSPVGEASDWYSFGVILYEALTGRLPFAGEVRQILSIKQRFDAPPPSNIAPEIPEDLNALCRELLRRDPQARPAGREILRRLQVADKSAAAIPAKARTMPGALFVGRAHHLAALDEAYQTVKQGHAATVFIHGSSGIGKTSLVQHFLRELRQREAVLVLEGRCYERESVPYKALDSVVDALTQCLKGLPLAEAAALMPDNTAALARLFPVLRRLEAVRRVRLEVADVADMRELRRRAFTALRELLARLAAKTHCVVFIDDLQWGDADSANLLEELTRPPTAPALLLIACYRQEEAETSPLLRALLGWQAKAGGAAEVRHLTVEEMTPSEARGLAVALTGLDGSSLSEAIARESKGNPFFINELALSRERFTEGQEILLDQVVQARVSQLPEPARRVLEVAAVAGEPIELDFAWRAAQLPTPEQAALVILRAGHLVRMRKTEGRDEIEMYHDRIREVVASKLDRESLRGHHGRLATVLEASGRANPETLLAHFQGAGDSDKARHYAVMAAEQAFAALAFERAARLYRITLDPGSCETVEAQRLRERLGDALTNAGRGGEAAEAYLAAAELMTGLEKLEMQRRGATQLLLSGRIDEGLAVARDVLQAVGVKLAKTMHRSLLRFLFWRARIRLRGLSFRERDASQISLEERLRIDTCFSVFQGLTMVDTFWSHEFHARNLLYSLRAGDCYRVARALASETGVYALPGRRHRERARKLLETATRLAERSGNPHAIGLATLESGVCAFGQGQWNDCRQRMDKAAATLRTSCTGVAWEIATSHMMGSVSLFFLGELKLLSERLPALLHEAESRGDLYQGTDLRSRLGHLPYLAADQSGGRPAREGVRRTQKGPYPVATTAFPPSALVGSDCALGD